jgi:hypothetical protein
MKKYTLFLLLFLLPFILSSQAKYDSVSVLLLDRMSNVMGELTSCKFTLSTMVDEQSENGSTITHFRNHSVSMVGPNKMTVDTHNEKGHHQYWYDGTVLNYYSHSENNFVTIPAPPTIISAIDSISKNYEIEFPAADLFYPTLTDDLIENFDVISYAGRAVINQKPVFHIMAQSASMELQLWISDDSYSLPCKFMIIDKASPERLRYEATFEKWELNPAIPESIFSFIPPPGAREIKILSVNDVQK